MTLPELHSQIRASEVFPDRNDRQLSMKGEFDKPLYTDVQYNEYEIEWENKSNCCCRIAYFPAGRFTVCGHWRRRMREPLLVSISFCIIHGIFVFDTFDKFPSLVWQICGLAIPSFFFLCLCFAYFATICKGPGYAPFNWAQSRKTKYTWLEMMQNMAIYQQQVNYAKQSERPPRSSFSIDARRYVLRADHFCLWAQTWIGVKNHRHFLLMGWYCFAYMLANIGFRYWWYIYSVKSFKWWTLFGWATIAALLASGFFAIYHFCVSVKNVVRNVTAVEAYNKRRIQAMNHGCLGNCEEICGTRKCLLCWPLPFIMCFKPLANGYYTELQQDAESAESHFSAFSQTGDGAVRPPIV